MTLSTGELGVIEGSFGKSGKLKIRLAQGLSDVAKDALLAKSQKSQVKSEECAANSITEPRKPIQVFLDYKKPVFGPKTSKIAQ